MRAAVSQNNRESTGTLGVLVQYLAPLVASPLRTLAKGHQGTGHRAQGTYMIHDDNTSIYAPKGPRISRAGCVGMGACASAWACGVGVGACTDCRHAWQASECGTVAALLRKGPDDG